MASRSDNDLCCPVCLEIFKDPVLLSCSHSFCKECLQKYWRRGTGRSCPVCRKRSASDAPPCNLALKNLCETFLQQREQRASEDLCSLHSAKVKLFCLNHQQPVCLVCRDSEKHTKHRFRPIDEAAQQHKKKLQETLEPLKKKLELRKKVQEEFDQTAEHLKVQAWPLLPLHRFFSCCACFSVATFRSAGTAGRRTRLFSSLSKPHPHKE
ncbi:E3 ubiquitin-protein ligase TRIM17-like [Poeciliopsis prolifica]|uniref:E3 ubiquitin-protein ligase TRIM17-like n=1 Tax=Poeciliopsis prolifica TaxID=188132 RepID=UPI002413E24D|nr:E3 ubiquitin-protein ligase TRIM17-like [Poeciliopsis prolifica]